MSGQISRAAGAWDSTSATENNGAESKVINRLRAKTTDTFLYK